MSQKLPIGKILLEKKKIDQDKLGQALDRQREQGGRLVSNLLAMDLAGEADLLAALGEQMGVPAVDLSRSIIPLALLDLVPEHVAQSANLLPIGREGDRLQLAMSNPNDRQTVDEVQFVTGLKAEPYVCIEARIKTVVQQAYEMRKRDKELAFFRGEQAQFPDGQTQENGYLAIVSESLPEPDVIIEPDEEILVVEVSTDTEVLEEMASAASAADGPTILVVDDEPDIVRMLQKTLEKEGFRVVTATRGLEALQAVKQHAPQLVLLDAMLPEIHGFEICKKIKTSKRYGQIPVIMISAVYRGWRYAQDAKDAYGADDFFEKPFRLVPLMRRIRELLNAGPASSMQAETDPDAANAAYQKGVSLYQEKRYEEAEAALREAATLDPFSANVHYAMANVLLAQNRIYEAMRAYEQTVELKPDLFVPLRNLAILYQKKGFRNKAMEMWERALRYCPEGEREQVKEQLIKLL